MRNLLLSIILFFSAINSFSQVLDIPSKCDVSIIERTGDTIIAIGEQNFYFENAFLAGDSCWNHGIDGYWRIFSQGDTSSLLFEANIVNGELHGTIKSFIGDNFERIAHYDENGLQESATEKHYFLDTTINQAFNIQLDFRKFIGLNTNAIVLLYTNRTQLKYILIIIDKQVEKVYRINESGILSDEYYYRKGRKLKTTHFISN